MEKVNFSMEQYSHELDEIAAPVMPESWEGHTRLTVSNAKLTGKQKTFATKLANRLVESRNVSREGATNAAIEKAREKIDG